MKWVNFNVTPINLVVANAEDRKRRLIVALPQHLKSNVGPDSEVGVKFSSLGFKYQAKNNAWYRLKCQKAEYI